MTSRRDSFWSDNKATPPLDLMAGTTPVTALERAMREDAEAERTERFYDRDLWTPSQKHAQARCAPLTPRGPR